MIKYKLAICDCYLLLLKDDTDTGRDPERDIKKEPLFSDDTIENETKPIDVKKTAVQDAGHAVKEENVKCNCDD